MRIHIKKKKRIYFFRIYVISRRALLFTIQHLFYLHMDTCVCMCMYLCIIVMFMFLCIAGIYGISGGVVKQRRPRTSAYPPPRPQSEQRAPFGSATRHSPNHNVWCRVITIIYALVRHVTDRTDDRPRCPTRIARTGSLSIIQTYFYG